MTTTRRQIVRACKARGWTIQPAALAGVEAYLGSSRDGSLEDLLNVVAERIPGQTITGDLWDDIAGEAADTGRSASTTMTTTDAWDGLQIVNAFQSPKLVFEVMRKNFAVDEKPRSLFGTAEDKISMLAQRYAMVHQRILRHKLFRPADLHARQQSIQHKLTPVESLLGKHDNQSLLILGILLQIEEGQWYLEDPTGQVQISFQDASAVDGFFVTEHCILLVEGMFRDGTFCVHRLGHPLLESRETSLQTIRQQVFHPSFRKPVLTVGSMTKESSLVVLSDLHLDQPRVLQQLESLFATYDKYAPDRLPLFVLMGNFSSTPQSHPSQLTPLLDELATLIGCFANLRAHAHFCLVPGPHDGVGYVLPLPALRKTHALDKIAHVHLASNPCRIQWRDQDIVVFRYDLLHLFQHHQIRLPGTDRAASDDDDQHGRQPHCRLLKTILDQGHVTPVAGVPIFWNLDHALSLYPLPTALILGGDTATQKDAFHEVYGGVHVLHPGAWDDGSYAVYTPGRPETAMVADEEDAPRVVEFGRVGVIVPAEA
jgi:DNA polymerase epsilon subunit 2